MLALQGSLINRPFNGCEPKMACSPRHSKSPNNQPLCEPRMACSPSFLLTSPCLCHLACITLAYITKAKAYSPRLPIHLPPAILVLEQVCGSQAR
ncbi:hypothetical protein TIFTF001_021643 [Ficus carica]|uniref:Uncharacterized protein n=1 Tax=Ficus carica TaxID=3494 RepID=A0AA88DJU5_FICCA|nr:hypothetical protein TIFTF001_021643 [Ficus carica]